MPCFNNLLNTAQAIEICKWIFYPITLQVKALMARLFLKDLSPCWLDKSMLLNCDYFLLILELPLYFSLQNQIKKNGEDRTYHKLKIKEQVV